MDITVFDDSLGVDAVVVSTIVSVAVTDTITSSESVTVRSGTHINVFETVVPTEWQVFAGLRIASSLSQRILTLYDPSTINGSPRYLVLGTTPLAYNAVRDDTLGSPLPPSLKVRQNVIVGPIRWPVSVGTNTLTVDCLYTPDDGAATRPQVVAKANAAIGLLADLTVTIAAGADTWHTSPSLSFVAIATGVIDVYLITRNPRVDGSGSVGSPFVTANWDHIVRS